MFARRGSEDPMALLIGLGFFAIIMFVAYMQSVMDKKRREAIRSYCRQHGLSYSDTANKIPAIARSFSLLSEKGHTNSWRSEMAGKREDYSFTIFEHYYVTGYGKSRHTYINTICVISKNEVNMPQFFVRDENFILDGLGKLFGGQDINFEEDPVFSKKFVLQGMSEPSIRQFFDRRVRKTFVDKHIKGYQYEGYHNCLVTCVSGSLDINGRMALLSNALAVFVNIIPREEQDYLG